MVKESLQELLSQSSSVAKPTSNGLKYFTKQWRNICYTTLNQICFQLLKMYKYSISKDFNANMEKHKSKFGTALACNTLSWLVHII